MTTKERPILFSGPMVRAILAGKKTQTRRVMKRNAPFRNEHKEWEWYPGGEKVGFHAYNGPSTQFNVPGGWASSWCPFGAPGDHLYVRETWTSSNGDDGSVIPYYKADGEEMFGSKFKWRPSIHMPRWASRITLGVSGIRVERLQEISEDDAIAEGVEPKMDTHIAASIAEDTPHRMEFWHLWESLNAKRGYGWETNPWVWVVEFRKL